MARTAKALGAKSVIDTSGTALAAVLEEGVTIIKPNLIELMEFVAVPLDREADRVPPVTDRSSPYVQRRLYQRRASAR